MKNHKTTITITIVCLSLLCTFALHGMNSESREVVINRQVVQFSRAANAGCPRLIDEHTRLDAVTPGNQFVTFKYTLLGQDDNTSFASKEKRRAADLVKSQENAVVNQLVNDKVIMTHEFYNEAGQYLFYYSIYK